MSEILIRSEGLVKRYDRYARLEFAPIQILSGAYLGIYGENGSGKSTLLRLLARISRPTKGEVNWARSLTGERIVFVPQLNGLYGNLTVADNVDLYARLYDIRLSEDTTRERFAPLGLDRFWNRPVGVLSGGYQKLAAIGCALAMHPAGIFLDEPFSSLDAQHVSRLTSLLQQLRGELKFLVGTDHGSDTTGLFTQTLVLSRVA